MHLGPTTGAAPGDGPLPIRELITDRAWNDKRPERWAYQLKDIDISQVVDLHKNDHGVRDHDGRRIVAGSPHCPAMPEDLINIRRPARLVLGNIIDETLEDEEVPRSVAEPRRWSSCSASSSGSSTHWCGGAAAKAKPRNGTNARHGLGRSAARCWN